MDEMSNVISSKCQETGDKQRSWRKTHHWFLDVEGGASCNPKVGRSGSPASSPTSDLPVVVNLFSPLLRTQEFEIALEEL